MKKALLFIGLPIFIVTTIFVQLVIAYSNSAERMGTTGSSSSNTIALPLATDIEAGINQYRVSQGLGALNSDVPALDQAAQARAEQMCKDNDWSHNRDWEILTPYYNYAYAGENLYYGFLQKDQATVAVNAWIASPTHQHNMVDNYNEMGVGVKACPGFQNEPTAVIVTNYFGVPR
jgi:uncharacterized protein YkwD